MATMTGRQRLLAAHRGEPVDRVSIFLREGFPVGERFPAPDDFSNGWMHDPLYKDMFSHVAAHADPMPAWDSSWGNGWFVGGGDTNGWGNRYLMTAPQHIQASQTRTAEDIIRIDGTIATPRGTLTFISERRRNDATTWYLKPPVETIEELEMLAEAPVSVHVSDLQPAVANYQSALQRLGERGILRTWLPSPVVCISSCMSFELFLELTATHRAFIHELLQEVTRRAMAIIDCLFKGRALDTTVCFGGSEQCTPPMMSPHAYDEFVVPYDGALVARLKEYGAIPVCHCHGKISRALHCIRDMGFAATDPAEPPPAGDVTYEQARAIVGDRVTLIGNLEWDEMCFAEPAHIRQRVKDILSLGNRRLILSTSAGPIGPISPQIAANYRAFVDAALEFGG
jgi:uroporphyrinogen-III decarboxylase